MKIYTTIAIVTIIVIYYVWTFIKDEKRHKKRRNKEREMRERLYDLSDLKELDIMIPEPKLTCAGFHNDRGYYRAIINESILDVKPREAYPWLLEVFFEFKNPDKDGFPGEDEAKKMYKFNDKLNKKLVVNKSTPNAVFYARVVGNGWGVLYWYVHNYDIADNDLFVMSMLKDKLFKFGYELKEDKNWEYAHSLIDPLNSTPEVEPNNDFQF